MSGIDFATVQRFWKYVEPGDGCWRWKGGVSRKGYGYFRAGGQCRLAHRISYCIASGVTLPELGDMQTCHRCDNPRCVRPDHLFLGTNSDNQADKVRKGRSRNGAHVHNGTRVWSNKLTPEQVREIRASTEGRLVLAARYGVDKVHINSIRARRTWKRLP